MKYPIYTYDPKKNREVLTGIYDEFTLRFTKEVKPEHYMIKEKGYGIQEDIIQELILLGCEQIRFISKTKIIDFPFELVLEKPIKNYGHGEQRFIKAI